MASPREDGTRSPSAVLLFYHYQAMPEVSAECDWQRNLLSELGICGRLRVAPAGLNGTLSGQRDRLRQYSAAVTARHSEGHRIDWKLGAARETQLFLDLSVRAVDEVVSLGVPEQMAPLSESGRHVSPREFHELLHGASADSRTASIAPVVLLDARNVYESRIGHFEAPNVETLLPPTRQFTDLPSYLDAHLDRLRGRKVLMYCTGGVRCEPASAYLRQRLASDGYSTDETDVLQLAGGIERYMEAFPEGGFFRGINLVFDRRLATAPPQRVSHDVIGRCSLCNAPTDDYAPQRRCFHCRLLLLVCPRCCEVYPQRSPTLACGECVGSTGSSGGAGRSSRQQKKARGKTQRPLGELLDDDDDDSKTRTSQGDKQLSPVPPPTEQSRLSCPPPPSDIALPQRENRRSRHSSIAQAERSSVSAVANDEPRIDTEANGCTVVPTSLALLGAWASCDAPVHFEYLDHTADVQIHSWGSCVEEAFEQQVIGIMTLITELPTVRVPEPIGATGRRTVSVEGHDLQSLLYNFLDEWLFQFNAESFVCRRIKITSLNCSHWTITSEGVGENFELGRHPQGTEVKAITYSALRITEGDDRTDVLVIVDI